MNKTEKALVVSIGIIVVLGVTVNLRNHQIKDLHKKYKKLYTWAEIAQRVMRETVENNPDIALSISETLSTDIDFYTIIDNENLI